MFKLYKYMTINEKKDYIVQGNTRILNHAVFDKNCEIRKAVAEQGRDKDLDILVHDESKYVRASVAQQRRL